MIELYDITENFMERNKLQKTVVCDMDEVLCNICPVWVRFLKENEDIFGAYYNLDEEHCNSENIMNRSVYWLETYLAIDGVVPSKDIHEIFLGIPQRPDFYTFCVPTKLAVALKKFAESKMCEQLIILSASLGEVATAAKSDWLAAFFGSQLAHKIIFETVPVGESKGEFLKNNNIKWDTFIDDLPTNIYDVVRKAEGFGKEIIVPKLGYNINDKRLLEMEDLFNLQLYFCESGNFNLETMSMND